MAKDLTKFKIADTETWLPKNRLVLSCLKQFFKDVIVGDYNYLKKTWTDEIQGGAGIIVALEEVTNERYYFMDDTLTAPDGKKYVVCNQWGTSNFERFTKLAAAMGYPIESNQSELISNTKETESDNFVNTNSPFQKNHFKEYFSKEGEDLKLKIQIYGSMHQLYHCTKEEDQEIDEIDNHYENSLYSYYKIDSDNFIIIELNNEKIFEGEVSELGINNPAMEVIENLFDDVTGNIAFRLQEIKEKGFTKEIDIYQIKVSTKNNLLVVDSECGVSLDYDCSYYDKPLTDRKSDNRYTMIEYGKYHLQTSSIKLKSFKISDLFFQKDTNVESLTGSSTGVFYCFSKIFHKELNELDFETYESNVKDTEFYQGWPMDNG